MSMDIVRELDRVIASDQHDPFQVLGFHLIDRHKPSAVIRTFQPLAESVRLVLGPQKIDMYKMRPEGLFEIVISSFQEPVDYHFEVTLYNGVARIVHDPYRALPQLTDFDCHLFNSGTHYRLDERLGAHPLVIDGQAGVIFRVWAPSARRVSVIGDFNYWDGRAHQMRAIGSSGIWELFIPGLGEGDLYKFEIRAQNMDILEKIDPLQFSAELRPKSASIVAGLAGYDWHDADWLARRDGQSIYQAPMSIYEVHLGSWRRDPANAERFLSFRELADSLVPYVKGMGFTHIELLPVMEHPLDESWGYQVTGYFSTTSRFGSPQDFMYFIDQCHANGIGVILDWVPSHFPTDGHSLGRFDGTALYEHADPRQGHHPEWGTFIFNYGRKEVVSFLISNAMFWLEKFHIDGLRVDAVASMLYLDYARREGQWLPNPHGGKENLEAIEFMKHLNSVIYDRFPGVAMIAEESTSFYGVSKPADAGGLGFGFKWNMGWMNDTLSYFSRDPLYRKYHHNALTFSLLYAFSENFILPLSHDEVVHGKRSLLSKMPGDEWQQFANLRLLFFYLWTHPGKKILFMGGEFGQLSEWYCKVSLDWHLVEERPRHRQLQDFVRDLNRFYRESRALWEEDHHYQGFQWLDFKDVNNSIIAYARKAKDPGEHLICLLNFTPQVHHDYRLGVLSDVPYRQVFCSDSEAFGGSGVENGEVKLPIHEPFGEAPMHIKVSVPPLAGIIFKPEPHKQ
ncbi:MAG: 1,4-alpha-glucan branching protein GlgB [Desulfobacteraceae bacterium]|nr:1,4-alpha-glucan branching protein GlgB [Desulfobacteraceae bacterium]